jgi:oligopeptide transport system ATP-binding protein
MALEMLLIQDYVKTRSRPLKNETTPLLSIQDLHVCFETFSGNVQAVRGVSFDVERGQTVAIVGESGCGKSVTAQSILKLIPMPPGKIKSGQILFEGKDLVTYTEAQMRSIRGREIGMIFQDPMTSLNPTLSIGYQIQEVLVQHAKMNYTQAKIRVLELLKLVGIPDPETRIDQYPHEFSGGMRQRAMIAMGLACEPKLLIADEPTTALDVTIQAQILELMKEIQSKTQTSIILITHDLGVVAGMADKVVVMYGGEVVEYASVDQIFNKPSHPYTKALLAAIPRSSTSRDKKLQSIEGSPPDLAHPPKGCAFCSRCSFAMKVCKDYAPPLFSIGENHASRCFLHHDHAGEMKQQFERQF